MYFSSFIYHSGQAGKKLKLRYQNISKYGFLKKVLFFTTVCHMMCHIMSVISLFFSSSSRGDTHSLFLSPGSPGVVVFSIHFNRSEKQHGYPKRTAIYHSFFDIICQYFDKLVDTLKIKAGQ